MIIKLTPHPHQDLRTATSSEPLTLHEEHSMQQSWRLDADKLTFIICLAPSPQTLQSTLTSQMEIKPELHDDAENMVGDVNLFLYPADRPDHPRSNENDNEHEGEDDKGKNNALTGEIEIMIARKEMQGHGYGAAALSTFLWYILSFQSSLVDEYHQSCSPPRAASPPTLEYLRVRIVEGNQASIRLFEKMRFKKTSSVPNYFGQIEMRVSVSELAKERFGDDGDAALGLPRVLRYGAV